MYIVIIFSIFLFLLGFLLSFSIYIFPKKKYPIIEAINQLLPQSQCGQCGYSGCFPYAKAIVNKNEKFDKCLPGGNDLILKISQVLNMENVSKNISEESRKKKNTIVWINEENCVGCSKCASFCPVDAIVGAPNFIHTVLPNNCTGCNICLLHCPTNCIQIIKRKT